MSEREMLERAAATRDDVAIWGSVVLLHLWGATGYLQPGWLPAAAGTVQLVILLALFYGARRTRAAAALAPTAPA